ncbi:MAG: ATP-binding protein [candidate division WOR-3 bacterium]
MSNFDIKAILYDQNPWWLKPDFVLEEAKYPRRDIFYRIENQLNLNQISAIVGLRRTGKTTVLKQIIGNLLSKKQIPSRNILFFSFDQTLVERKIEFLEAIITIYLEQILSKKVWEIDQQVYMLLDEIQYVPNWQVVLKRFYDQTKKIKFIISGSASLFVKEKSKESLAGRIFIFEIPVLSFREYLRIKKAELSLPLFTFKEFNLKPIEELSSAFSTKITGLFEDYIIRGQFPEIITQNMDDKQVKQYLIDSILAKILEVDIPLYFNIKRVDEIRSIYRIAAVETGNQIEYDTIARDVGISRNTVADYFNCLEKAFLINILYNYTKSIRKGLRTIKKGYATSTNFSAMLNNITESSPQFKEWCGHYVETYVKNILHNEYESVFFVKRRDKELDFLIKSTGELIPVEVKYTNKITQKEIKNLLYFMEQLGINRGYVLTKASVEMKRINGKEIVFVPVWML